MQEIQTGGDKIELQELEQKLNEIKERVFTLQNLARKISKELFPEGRAWGKTHFTHSQEIWVSSLIVRLEIASRAQGKMQTLGRQVKMERDPMKKVTRIREAIMNGEMVIRNLNSIETEYQENFPKN
jgi:hypothetical protein